MWILLQESTFETAKHVSFRKKKNQNKTQTTNNKHTTKQNRTEILWKFKLCVL